MEDIHWLQVLDIIMVMGLQDMFQVKGDISVDMGYLDMVQNGQINNSFFMFSLIYYITFYIITIYYILNDN